MAVPRHSVKQRHSGADEAGDNRYAGAMTKETEKQAKARAERMAAALRANLRKRKGLGQSADPDKDQHPAPKVD
jgi:hypothetical protein